MGGRGWHAQWREENIKVAAASPTFSSRATEASSYEGSREKKERKKARIPC